MPAPDLALIAAAVLLFHSLFLSGGSAKLFRDSDAGWHIRTGEWILEQRAAPRTDLYSFTRSGQPWMDWEWATDAVTGMAHRAAGLRGVAWFYGLAIAAGVWLWVRLSWVAGGDFLIACAMLPVMASTASLHWLARPHVVGWIWMLVALIAAEKVPATWKRQHMLAAFSVGALWANTHASFILGLTILLLYAMGEAVAWALWGGGCAARARWYLLVALFGLAGSFVNPYGFRLHAHVAAYLTDQELLARVAEFQTFNFHAPGAGWALTVLLLTAAGAACAFHQKQAGRFLALSFLGVVALRSARGLPLAAMAALPLANGAITLALCRVDGLREGLAKGLNAFLRYSGNLRKIERGFSRAGWLLAPMAAGAAFVCLGIPAAAAKTGFAPEDYPAAMVERLNELPQDSHVYAPDKFGGYLIYRFKGTRKVFFDGRSDFYGADFMKQYLRIAEARPGWQNILKDYAIKHALVPSDGPLGEAMGTAGWKLVAKDKVAALYEAPRMEK